MKRLFQDNEGIITDFIGVCFDEVIALSNINDNDCILFWLKNKNTTLWYRLFVDGVYEYKHNELIR